MKTPLAAGVALALGVSGAGQVIAQEDSDTTSDDAPVAMEEVVVTGIRASLISAQSLKENADTFVDGVTSQDIGALPDRSVAEALPTAPCFLSISGSSERGDLATTSARFAKSHLT